MTGSWVWKPGDRHARPTCCIEAVKGPPGGRTVNPLEDGRLVERSNFRGRGRLCIRGEEPGSFFTVICGPPLPAWDLRTVLVCEVLDSLNLSNLSTYGDAGPLSVGEPWAADPCLGLLDIRGGESLDGILFGGAKDGRFLGLGLRVGCGDDKGAAADATAVDMVDGDNDSSSSGYGITAA